MLVKRGHSGFGMSAFLLGYQIPGYVYYTFFIRQESGVRPCEVIYPHEDQRLFFLIMKPLE